MTTTWVAALRSAVIGPSEEISFKESRAFAGQTVRQGLHLDGGGEALRVRLTNRYGAPAFAPGAGECHHPTPGGSPGATTASRPVVPSP